MAEPQPEPSAAIVSLLSLLEGERAAGAWVPEEYAAFRAWYQSRVGSLPPPQPGATEEEEPPEFRAAGGEGWQSLLAALMITQEEDEEH